MTLLMTLLIFLLGGIIGFLFTRNVFIAFTIGMLFLLIYYQIILIQLNWTKLIPASIRELIK